MEGGNFKYITLTKDSEGNYVKWFYTVDGRDVGTDYASKIFYVLNQKMSSLWNNRIKSKDVDHKWLTAVSGNNWKIVSGGSALAEMNNGSFTGSGQIEKYLGEGIADKYSLLYSKDGNFSVVNTSSEETFEADVAGLSQGAMVKTTSGSITFAINDATGTNQVILDGREGDTFEATFRSALGSASGKETMTISGKNQGSEVVIGLSGSDVVVNNCTDVAITLNDAPVTNLEDLGKNINFYDINLEYTEAAYNGSPIEPGIIVSGREMIPGTDYTISYKDNIGIPGETTTAAAIIQGTGSYTGTKTLLFTILPGKDLSGYRISEIKDRVYTGKAITPKFTVTYDGTALVIDTDYTVTWKNNQKIGTATLTVTGKRMCTGTKSVTFRIIPKAVKLSSLKAGRKQLTVKWKAGKEIDGYEIQYGLKKNFKGAKTITVKKAKTVSAELKKLKSKKTYYVRIRAFKKVKGKKYYSDWSKTLSKKVK